MYLKIYSLYLKKLENSEIIKEDGGNCRISKKFGK